MLYLYFYTNIISFLDFKKEKAGSFAGSHRYSDLSYDFYTKKTEIGFVMEYLRTIDDQLPTISHWKYSSSSIINAFAEICDILKSHEIHAYSARIIYLFSPELYHHIEKNKLWFEAIHQNNPHKDMVFYHPKNQKTEIHATISLFKSKSIDVSLQSLLPQELLLQRAGYAFQVIAEFLISHDITFYSPSIVRSMTDSLVRALGRSKIPLSYVHEKYIAQKYSIHFLHSSISKEDILFFTNQLYAVAKKKWLSHVTATDIWNNYPSLLSSNYFKKYLKTQNNKTDRESFAKEFWNYNDVRFTRRQDHIDGIPFEEYISTELSTFFREHKSSTRSPVDIEKYNPSLYNTLRRYGKEWGWINRLYVILYYFKEDPNVFNAFRHRFQGKLPSWSKYEIHENMLQVMPPEQHNIDIELLLKSREKNEKLSSLLQLYLSDADITDEDFNLLVLEWRKVFRSDLKWS